MRARLALGLALGAGGGAVDAVRATSGLWLTPVEVVACWAASVATAVALGLALALIVRTRRGVVAVGAVAALLLAAGAVRWTPRPTPRGGSGPSVLLVTLDTARGDRFGTRRVHTLAHDRLAREGVRFTSAWAQIPVTGPSHAALLSGRSPWDNEMLFNGDPVPGDIPLLAERLRAEGWDTGAFVSAAVLRGGLGYARGFSVYADDFGRWRGLGRTVPGRLVGRPAPVERDGGAAVDEALAWIDSRVGPWLAWVHLFEPHGPYEPPPPWDREYYPQGRDPRSPEHRSMAAAHGVPAFMGPSLEGITDSDWVVAQYEGEISHADRHVGRLLDHLDRAGSAGDTLVVLTADHGEGLGEHGEWFRHGGMLYDQDLHVPLVLRLPDRLPRGVRIDAPVELGDVAPTIIELLGLEPEAGHTGASLLPLVAMGPAPRPIARAMAWDEELAREMGISSTAGERAWRVVSARSRDRRVIAWEHPSRGEPWVLGGFEAPEEQAAALGLLEAWDAADHAQRVHLEDRHALEALGYLSPE